MSLPQRVEKKTFDLLLQGLLSHSVPETPVVEVDSSARCIFVDARERKEFDVSHIENAVWAGYDDFDVKRLDAVPYDTTIVVYCSVGYRSEKIAEKLVAAGFRDVFNLYGGIFEWKNSGRPVVNKDGVTENVHAYDRVWGIWLNKGKKVY